LLDFVAGLLIGLSIVVALFAAMEESEGRLAQDMRLAALAALVLAVVLKLSGKVPTRRRGMPRANPPREMIEPRAPWPGDRGDGIVADARETASAARNYGEPRDARVSEARPKVSALHRDAHGSTADGDTRRL
jgi:hypothetical protein